MLPTKKSKKSKKTKYTPAKILQEGGKEMGSSGRTYDVRGVRSAMEAAIEKAESMERELESKEVPPLVIDEASYWQYLKLHVKYLRELRFIETPDPELVVDAVTAKFDFERSTQGLTELEKKGVRDKVSSAAMVIARAITFKRKAYGNLKVTSEDDVLLETHSSELIELFGRFYQPSEVLKIVRDDWNLTVTRQSLLKFRTQHIDAIAEKQEEYRKGYSNVRLGLKRSRLDELSFMYDGIKTRYASAPSREDYRLMLMTLEQLRKEVEGDVTTVQGSIDVNVQSTLNIHVQQEIIRSACINDIVIARVSARQGINPIQLMSSLSRSIYAKFAGFVPVVEDADEKPIILPSKSIYEFNDVAEVAQKMSEETKRKAALIVLTDTEHGVVETERERLIRVLRTRSMDVSDAVGRIHRTDQSDSETLEKKEGKNFKQGK